MLEEIVLDASEMAPPEPFEQARDILLALQPGQYLHMLHRRVPYPLFELCRERGLAHGVIERSRTECEIFIYYPADEPALRAEGLL